MRTKKHRTLLARERCRRKRGSKEQLPEHERKFYSYEGVSSFFAGRPSEFLVKHAVGDALEFAHHSRKVLRVPDHLLELRVKD